jgi:hypothetical protein
MTGKQPEQEDTGECCIQIHKIRYYILRISKIQADNKMYDLVSLKPLLYCPIKLVTTAFH